MKQTPLKVLMVEDHRADAVLLQELLLGADSDGFELAWERRLEKAVTRLQMDSFDAVLLDLTLPDSQGLSTLERVQAAARDVPLIVVTGLEDEKLAVRAIRQGAQDYLVKGTVDGRGIARAIRYSVDRKKAGEMVRKLNESLEQRVQDRTRQLRQLTLELTQAEQRERKRLAAVLHDHLQQLLVCAKLSAQIAQKQARGDLQAPLAKVIHLLDESVKASKSLTMELSPPILHEAGLVSALQWLARWMQETYGLSVEIAATEEIDPDPEGLCILLFQAVRELLFNVVKHAGVKEAQVDVSWTESQELLITVTDAGCGFVSSQPPAPSCSSGFGLFTIRERLSLLGGSLQIRSEPQQGTQARLTAPLPRTPVAAAGSPPLGLPAAVGLETPCVTGQNIRVLVADDHQIMREGLVQLLAAEPELEVVGEAEDGEQAVQMALRLRPDVVIMDLGMPGLNGVEATRRILSKLRGVRIIGLSMYELSGLGRVMLEAGAVAYLHKAGRTEELLATIKAGRPSSLPVS